MQVEMFAISKAQKRFQEFHEKNPHVYTTLVEMARELKAVGHSKIGMQMLFEVIRWKSMRRTVGDQYKMNNDYASRYSRLIMDTEPDLDGYFETRQLHS